MKKIEIKSISSLLIVALLAPNLALANDVRGSDEEKVILNGTDADGMPVSEEVTSVEAPKSAPAAPKGPKARTVAVPAPRAASQAEGKNTFISPESWAKLHDAFTVNPEVYSDSRLSSGIYWSGIAASVVVGSVMLSKGIKIAENMIATKAKMVEVSAARAELAEKTAVLAAEKAKIAAGSLAASDAQIAREIQKAAGELAKLYIQTAEWQAENLEAKAMEILAKNPARAGATYSLPEEKITDLKERARFKRLTGEASAIRNSLATGRIVENPNTLAQMQAAVKRISELQIRQAQDAHIAQALENYNRANARVTNALTELKSATSGKVAIIRRSTGTAGRWFRIGQGLAATTLILLPLGNIYLQGMQAFDEHKLPTAWPLVDLAKDLILSND